MMFKLALLCLYFLHASLEQSTAANLPVDVDVVDDDDMSVSSSMDLRNENENEIALESFDLMKNDNHSAIYGQRQEGDRLLFQKTVVKGKNSKKHFMEIRFPTRGTKNNRTINYMALIDNRANGNGGYAFYNKGGGVGYKGVALNFMSLRDGFNFTAIIYGINDKKQLE